MTDPELLDVIEQACAAVPTWVIREYEVRLGRMHLFELADDDDSKWLALCQTRERAEQIQVAIKSVPLLCREVRELRKELEAAKEARERV